VSGQTDAIRSWARLGELTFPCSAPLSRSTLARQASASIAMPVVYGAALAWVDDAAAETEHRDRAPAG
jgi:hypothetical protein